MKKTLYVLTVLFFLVGFTDIFSQPVISQQPQDQSVFVGETATFSLVATGIDPIIYQWYKDGVSIAGANTNTYSTPSTIIDDDGSVFYCLVTDSSGFVQSDNAILSVSYPNNRVTDGLQVLYDFDEGSGTVISDLSGVGTPLNLDIDNLSGVFWTQNGLNINSQVRIKSTDPANKIYDACTASNEFTFEAWLMPTNNVQRNFYTRILTIANDDWHESNFKIVQSQSNYHSLLRTSTTNLNGDPDLVDTAIVAPVHFVYTRDNLGNVVSYINGVKASEQVVSGDFSNWNSNYYLYLGNEIINQLYWEGTYYQLAIYSKALSVTEVEQNFNFGTTLDNFPLIVKNPENNVANVDQTVTFSVTAIGTAPLNYQWRKNGVDISGANSSSYTTPPLTASDNNSTYTCYVSNAEGSTTSSGAELVVLLPGTRIVDGAIAIYNFTEGSGNIINDQSGVGSALNLNISDQNDVVWTENGLEISSEANIISSTPATKIYDRCTLNNEFSIEAWIKPANVTQSGPARIITFSQDANARNFTLAQDSNKYEFRVRTDQSTNNGKIVVTPAGSAETTLQHIVVVVSVNNVARVYVNGVEQLNKDLGNNISNWDNSYRLALANELLDSRPWLGTFNYVAIFDRVLFAAEVQHNYEVGAFGLSNILSPTNLAASETTIGQINLSWVDNSDNEDKFIIERSLLDTLHFVQVGETLSNVTSFTDTSITEGTAYYYRVKASNTFSNTNSEYSNQYSIISKLFTPSNLNSDASILGEVSLTWSDNSSSENGYIIERGIGDPVVYTVIDSVNQDNFKDVSVNEGILYSYRVKAYNDLIESSYSNVKVVRSKASFVNKPTELTVELHSEFGIPVLTWVDNAFNEKGYVIERRLIQIGTTFNRIDTVGEDGTTYMDETVQDSSSYIYRVFAFNDEYVSEMSAEVFIDVLVGIEDEEAIPTEFNLAQNYPNPFNPSTTIKFGLPTDAKVVVKVYNLLGQELLTLVNNHYSAGVYSINFDASKLTSGVYIYTIAAKNNLEGSFVQSKKMILLK